MLQFLQPAATLFIGFAMFAYGVVQAVLHRPSPSAFSTAVAALPDAVAVLIFILGLAAILTGIFLLVTGVRGVRSRTREINHAYGPRNLPRNDPRNHPGPGEHRHPRDAYDDEWDPAYG